ncbi:hypothetical protein GW17_00042243 [Ensete ventricosum]|nr:hypothetical protein GW17_00042243 [Ensete ventricosum]
MATASPLAGAAGYGQPPCRGGRLRPGPLQGVVDCSQGHPVKGRSAAISPPARGIHPQGQQPRGHDRLRPACKGLPLAASPQGPTARSAIARGSRPRPCRRWRLPHCKVERGSPAARAVSYKGGRWQEWPPVGATPARGDAPSPRGAARRQQGCHLCSATTTA